MKKSGKRPKEELESLVKRTNELLGEGTIQEILDGEFDGLTKDAEEVLQTYLTKVGLTNIYKPTSLKTRKLHIV